MAHRGASGRAPEHTRAAFAAALRCGADWIECDARLTRDGEVVLWHDARVDRTSDGSGAVCALTLRQLRLLDCGSWFHPRFAGERVLTLTEALRLVRGHARLNVELKTDDPMALPHLVTRAIQSVQRCGAAHRAMLSSFDPAALEQARRRTPRLPRALITARHPRASLRVATALAATAIHPQARLATDGFIRRAHAVGLAVHVWTVDAPRIIRTILARGADGLFSNYPERIPRWSAA